MSLSQVYPSIVTSNVTAGNLLADTTTANAFIAPVGIDFSPYRGDMIEIYSGTTLWAQAWISETAPTALEEATDVLAGWDLTSGWSKSGTTTINDADTFTSGSTAGYVSKDSMASGKLYKSTLVAIAETGSVIAFTSAASMSLVFTLSDGVPKYFTNPSLNTSWLVYHYNTSNGKRVDVTSQTSYLVTSPASTGALLLSTKGGSRGWLYKHASFNPNAAVTLRILARRKIRGNGSAYL